MQANEDLIREVTLLPVSEELGISLSEFSLDKLRLALMERLWDLLESDHNKLVNLLYRIDVEEKLAREAFSLARPDKIAESLADLIIRRLLKKAESRLKYRNNEL